MKIYCTKTRGGQAVQTSNPAVPCSVSKGLSWLFPPRFVVYNVHLFPGLLPLPLYSFLWQISHRPAVSRCGVSNTRRALFPQFYSIASLGLRAGACPTPGHGTSVKLKEKNPQLLSPFLHLCTSWKTLPNPDATLVPSSHICRRGDHLLFLCWDRALLRPFFFFFSQIGSSAG